MRSSALPGPEDPSPISFGEAQAAGAVAHDQSEKPAPPADLRRDDLAWADLVQLVIGSVRARMMRRSADEFGCRQRHREIGSGAG
jgi:hypothetical protein